MRRFILAVSKILKPNKRLSLKLLKPLSTINKGVCYERFN
nr:MAG TPA: hypothetical protein [Caudoviricetes sp.]